MRQRFDTFAMSMLLRLAAQRQSRSDVMTRFSRCRERRVTGGSLGAVLPSHVYRILHRVLAPKVFLSHQSRETAAINYIMEDVRITFRKLRREQRKAKRRLEDYDKGLAKRLQQPGLTNDSLVSELQGLDRRRTQLETVRQRTEPETGRFRLFRRLFGPPQKEQIDAWKEKIENFSKHLHTISMTLKLDIPNAVIKANIEAPFQSRYLDLLNQQSEAEERHQGSDWTQHSLNREIREIADRRWEVERLREEIGRSAANGFDLFLQPNRQDLTNLDQRLTQID